MRKSIIKVLSLILIVSITLIAFAGCKKQETTPTPTTTKPEVTIPETNPLTGLSDISESAVGKRPLAIVVENSPAARPQWGLGSADITIEGLVEGGITRMLWVYADPENVPKVGPTRSARIDFLEMAEGLDAIFVHYGGAATAYSAIKSRNVDDIDGAGKGNVRGTATYFDRDSSRGGRGTEHTAYTTGEWLTEALSKTGIRTDIKTDYATPFSFNKETTGLTGGVCTEIAFTFSSSYKHTFKYNSETDLYYNYMNTSEMVDENGKQMSVSNVILLYYPSHSYIPNTTGSIDMNLSGGSGVVASHGTYQNITWTKGGPSDMLKLFDENGNQLKLNTGKNYIGLIPAANSSATAIQ